MSLLNIVCIWCGGRTVLKAEMKRVGQKPGAKVYCCSVCHQLHWQWVYEPAKAASAIQSLPALPTDPVEMASGRGQENGLRSEENNITKDAPRPLSPDEDLQSLRMIFNDLRRRIS
jgi:hypothetical protein